MYAASGGRLFPYNKRRNVRHLEAQRHKESIHTKGAVFRIGGTDMITEDEVVEHVCFECPYLKHYNGNPPYDECEAEFPDDSHCPRHEWYEAIMAAINNCPDETREAI